MPHSEWPIQMLHYVPGPSSIVEMKRGALKVVKQCAAVKPGEVVVISADTNKLRIAEPLAAATVGVGVTPVVVMIPPTGAQPCLGSTYLSTGVDPNMARSYHPASYAAFPIRHRVRRGGCYELSSGPGSRT